MHVRPVGDDIGRNGIRHGCRCHHQRLRRLQHGFKITRIAAEQNRDGMGHDGDLRPEMRHGGLRLFQLRPRLQHRDGGAEALVFQLRGVGENRLRGLHIVFGDCKLVLRGPQCRVIGREFGQQADQQGPAGGDGGLHVIAGGLRRAAGLAEDIQLPIGIEAELIILVVADARRPGQFGA